MARVEYAPIVSSASGKVAGTVFSTWKGRPYIRRLVTPSNPQSALQTAQREAMARIVVLRRWLPASIKTAQNAFAAGLRMSGYNWFSSQNVVDEKTYDSGKLTPHHEDSPVVQGLGLSAGAAGVIAVAWTDPSDADATILVVLQRKVEPTSEADRLTQVDAFPVANSPQNISGLDTGELYRIFAFYSNAAFTIHGESDSAEQAAG